MQRRILISLPFVLLALFTLAPQGVSAATATTELEYSGWVPYWSGKKGPDDARKHLKQLDEVNPFTYSVKKDGSLAELTDTTTSSWRKLFNYAERYDVRIVPTIMWSDGTNIDRILTDPTLRAQHIAHIIAMVDERDYDGVDIDYEGKLAETRPYFSTFLRELKAALGTRMLACTIEARTPVPDRYVGAAPATAYNFANDYPSIGTYCDTVRLMTYDQQTADQRLNELRAGPYFPVADTLWTEKVAKLALKDIPADKLSLGVATYGRELIVTVTPSGTYRYQNDGAMNPKYADQIEKKYKVKRSTNAAGEQTVTYIGKDQKDGPSQRELMALAPKGTPSGEQVALGALAYAKEHNEPVTFRFLSWSDSGALAGHIATAEKLGLRGIALFKIDGGEDKKTWSVID